MRLADCQFLRTFLLAIAAGCVFSFFAPAVSAQDSLPDFGQPTPSSFEYAFPRGSKTLFRWAVGTPSESAEAESETLVTDRPHFSEASSLVGLGRVQVETGYTFTADRSLVSAVFGTPDVSQFVQTHSFPETLLRAGIFADWFEFRLAYDYLIERTINPAQSRATASGSNDLYVGAKLALAQQQGWLPEIALFPQMLVPSGSPRFTNGQVLPGFNLAYSWKISEFLELECNTQLNRRRDDVEHFYTEFIQTVNVEYTFTQKLGGFTEWFSFIPNGAISSTTGPQHYFHGGFVYFLTNNVQYDIHAAVGLNQHSDDFFAGSGLSIRF